MLLSTFEYRPEKAVPDKTYTLPAVMGRCRVGTPAFVLVDHKTASAAEWFAYTLQAFRKARVVGESSAGGAHANEYFDLDEELRLSISTGVPVSAATGTNWEGTGVVPDITCDPGRAIEVAIEASTGGAIAYTAAVEADAPRPAPGGMTAALADRFVAQLAPAAVEVLALLCHNAPQLTYEDLQAQAKAQLGISRAQIGGVLTSLAAARKRLPREVDYPITRDAQHRRYRIEPVAAELLLAAVDRARGIAPPKG